MFDTSSYNFTSRILQSAVACAFSLLFAMASEAGGEVERLTVVALAPMDGKAVIKLPDGEMQVVKPGDKLQGDTIIVVQILTDKLVIEERRDLSEAPPSKQLAWVYQAPVNGGYSRVMRLRQEVPVSAHAPLSAGRTISLSQP